MQLIYTNYRPLFYNGNAKTVNIKIKKVHYTELQEKINAVFDRLIGITKRIS